MSAEKLHVDAEGVSSQQDANEEIYLIGDLAREFNVTLRTLRFYEDRGFLSPKREGLRRIYSSRDRARLALILKGKQLGFTLTEIQDMVTEEQDRDDISSKLSLSMEQIDEQITHLENQKKEIEQALMELKLRRKAIA